MPSVHDDDFNVPPDEKAGISSTHWHPPPPPTLAVPKLEVTKELLRALPKTDLHCHLDGSMRLKTILELAEQQGVKLPASDEDALAKVIHKGEVCRNLEDYLVAFDVTCSVLQTEQALFRAAYELALDAAAENVRYLEVRYAPVLHQQRGLKLTAIVDSVLEGLRTAKRETRIKYGVILCGIRHMNPQSSVRLAELCVAYKNRGVVGFDLAGAEANFPAKEHREAFQLILKNNVNCTAHAGEAYGPESIGQALHYLGAHRIGHGVRLREDGDLLNYVNDHRIPLECCPSSNVQTRAVTEMAAHPLKFYFDYGLRVTINTDNRLITDTTVSDEYWIAHKELGLSLEDLTTVIVSGFKSAFLPFREKQDTLKAVNAELEATLKRFEAKAPAPAR
ncbi:MAG: adenosine deaminase [Myxococcaceae bacterium]|jgi:adenosine deaminase|nr:adenosine deaminase [Myxococcaceae bacterium]MCA3016058.1 adenosine deaminase [Myxococcaceae bacterium]